MKPNCGSHPFFVFYPQRHMRHSLFMSLSRHRKSTLAVIVSTHYKK